MKSYDDNGHRYVERRVQGLYPGTTWVTRIRLVPSECFGCPDILAISQSDPADDEGEYDLINISPAALQEMLKELEALH